MYSYLSTSPGSSARSWIRLKIGDNSSDDVLLQDEDIDAIIETEGSSYLAAAVCCETIAAKYSRQSSMTVGRLTIDGSLLSKSYLALAKRLRGESGRRVSPYAGGISRSDKQTTVQDSDRQPLSFGIGAFDNPAADLSTGDDV